MSEIIAQGQSRAGESPVETGRTPGQQTGHGPGLGFEGSFSAFLEVSQPALGRSFFGVLDATSVAQPLGTNEESGTDAPSTRAPDFELV